MSAFRTPAYSAGRPASAGGFVARRPAPSRDSLRRDWTCVVDLGERLARLAEGSGQGGQVVASPGDLARFGVALRDLKADNFPVEFASARTQAGAFLLLANRFAHADTQAAARSQMAGFLIAGAHALDVLLTAKRTEEASRDRVRIGERED